MLGDLVHLANRLVDLLDAGALFLARRHDLGHDVSHMFDALHHFIHRDTRFTDQLAAQLHLVHRITDEGLDFFCGGS
ncbi:hypothetical protein D3C81_2025930 [compost metagenome]